MDIINDLIKGVGSPIVYGRVITVNEDDYSMKVDIGNNKPQTVQVNGFQSTMSGIRALPLPNSIVILYYDLIGKFTHLGTIYPNHRVLLDETKKFRFNRVKSGEIEMRGVNGNNIYMSLDKNISIFSLLDLQMNFRAKQKILELLTRNIKIDDDFMQIRLGEAWRYSTTDQVMLPVQDIKTSIKYQQNAIPELNMIFGKRVPLTPGVNPDTAVMPLYTFKLANPVMDDSGMAPKLTTKGTQIVCEAKVFDQAILVNEVFTMQIDTMGALYTVIANNQATKTEFSVDTTGTTLKTPAATVETTAGIKLKSGTVPEEPMVMGQTLKTYLDSLKLYVDIHVHKDPISGVTGDPVTPSPTIPPTLLSALNKNN